jgi:hypothetical protein
VNIAGVTYGWERTAELGGTSVGIAVTVALPSCSRR